MRLICIVVLGVLAGCGASPGGPPVPTTTAPAADVLQVPTRLAVTRTADALTVAIGPDREAIELALDPALVAGVASTVRVRAEGAATAIDGGHGLSGGVSFNLGVRSFHLTTDGLPRPGTHYVVEVDLTLFETDVPPGHLWSPASPAYRARWTRTLTARVE